MIQTLVRWKRRSCATPEGRLSGVLQFPLPVPARIAILDDGFVPARNMRQFALSDWPAIRQWAPEAIVAPLGTALSLADRRLQEPGEFPGPRVALVVLTDVGGEILEKDYRELLWQAFGVPIFEQMRNREGAVIARECEVHDGLHVDHTAQLTQEINSALVHEPCECGAETPRFHSYFMVRMAATTLSASASLIF